MKKCLILACACLVAVMSCEIPQSITIKGKPGLYIPVGSPFASLDESERLENYISPNKVREMMGDTEAGGVKIYDYQDPGAASDAAQTYIVHYPIAEMKLDLGEYVKSATIDGEIEMSFEIPKEIENLGNQFSYLYPDGCYLTANGPSRNPGTPLFTINLSDMSKLLKEVTGGPFGLVLDNNAAFVNNLKVRIPALGINTYQDGVLVDGKLRYSNAAKTKFDPRTDLNNGLLEIFVLIQRAGAGRIAPNVLFEWETAKIDTSSMDDLSGSYPVANSLGDFLGQGVSFNNVQGRIYVGGIGNTATMTLKAGAINLIPPDSLLSERDKPIFENPFKKPLPQHSLPTNIDLTVLLNTPGTSTLEYQIKIQEWEINRKDLEGEEVVFADLVILLPLELKVAASSGSISGYVKLDLGDVFPEPGNDDIFGRTGKENDILKYLDSVKITLKNFKNDIIDNNVAILITAENYKAMLDLSLKEPFLEIRMDELPNPFAPRFEILLKTDTGADYATLKIKRQTDKPPEFDFFLTIEAKADINHTLSL